jgi:hypothetical protein
MARKQNDYSPQDYLRIGMAFFLLALLVSILSDGRMLGAVNISLFHDNAPMDFIQGFADGLLILLSGASIFFNLRGLYLLRCQRQKGIEE